MRYSSSTVNMSGNAARGIAVAFVALGAVLAVAAIVVNSITSSAWAERTERVPGTVVDVRETFGSMDSQPGALRGRNYCPIVQYTVEGTQYLLESAVCGNGRPDLGAEVTVRYSPNDPGDGVIESWKSRWLAVTILTGIGAGFIVFGGLAYVLFRSKRRMVSGPVPYGPAPGYGTPSFPLAPPGTVGLERGAVDILVARVEQAYQALSVGRRPTLTSHELTQTQLMPAPGEGFGYDRQAVEAYLASARSYLQQVETH